MTAPDDARCRWITGRTENEEQGNVGRRRVPGGSLMSLPALYRRVILWSFGAIVHGVVAHHVEDELIGADIDWGQSREKKKFVLAIDALEPLGVRQPGRFAVEVTDADAPCRMISVRSGHPADTNAVILEMLLATRALNGTMSRMLAPRDQRGLRIPPRMRQDDSGPIEAGVAVDEQQAGVLVELRPEMAGELEVPVRMPWNRLDLEKQSDHAE